MPEVVPENLDPEVYDTCRYPDPKGEGKNIEEGIPGICLRFSFAPKFSPSHALECLAELKDYECGQALWNGQFKLVTQAVTFQAQDVKIEYNALALTLQMWKTRRDKPQPEVL